ncbi:sn-glycerol-3-phosphate ABC transporter substrate-binding protein UgpB [Usitatibacter palustris]|uniref:sn-glycerol-3-phosphate-binding periplasmic protein UgpB n=1 Tax=Usitatibacter palustris TaxID=2732487 RepID=A0A6M4H4W9_9PROT|nr:sn-glycerol-3-phosphate ABC transporter substrate-binding protein UgpB [Usitatibacter palustris]QJR14540.1 sn-glycerol-3-phosphate-binding periplasmic protein UgpB [Usitatibacter palustris]
MFRKSLFAAVALAFGVTGAQAQTEIQLWHSMTGALGDKVNELANKFNASQKDYKVVAVYKGSYPESMTAAIASFRAGNAPHMLQVFEVGTATMMAAKGAVVPVYKLMKDADEPFNPKAYMPAVAGYYTDYKGQMLSFPFNSSTPVFYVNKDAYKKAGLDPNKAPKTWKEFAAVSEKLKASGQSCVYTTGWPAWVHVENFSAWHNLPIGTKENGIAGMDTEFKVNSPEHVKHIEMLADYSKKGWFTYSGRRNEAEARFFSGECAMLTSSSGAQANIRRNAKFDFSVNLLPYHDHIVGAPQNSIIGGASFWVMGGKTNNSYKGVAKFMGFLSGTEIQADWHQSTGYVPITLAAAEATKKAGYYEKNPGTDIAVRQLTNKPPTGNSKGLRFGNYVQGREVIEEEIEAVLGGKKSAKQAMDDAVRRGNDILRKFEAANKG